MPRSFLRPALAASLALGAGACERSEPGPVTTVSRAETPAPSAAPSATGLAPLEGPEIEVLALDGLGPATIALPRGATRPRPVIVAVHGHSVRPEHACRSWMRASHERAFVLCPHGLPARAGPDQIVTVGSPQYTLREIDAGLQALRARHGGYVADGPLVYAGYSLGARNGVPIVAEHGARFPLVALGEGGYDELNDRTMERFAKGGVKRVLLVCSSRACEITFGGVLKRCERAGLACKLAPSGEHPHLFAGAVVEATREAWPWLVEGDGRYGFER